MMDFKVKASAVYGSCVTNCCNDLIGFDLVAFGFEKFFQLSISGIFGSGGRKLTTLRLLFPRHP